MPKKKAGRAKMHTAARTAAAYRLPTAAVTHWPMASWHKAVSPLPRPAPARARASPRRERVLSASRPPAHAPTARQASTTPIRLVHTTADVPTCGANTRAPTISSTMTSAPLIKTVSSSILLLWQVVRRMQKSAPPRLYFAMPAYSRRWPKKSWSKEAHSSESTPPMCHTR